MSILTEQWSRTSLGWDFRSREILAEIAQTQNRALLTYPSPAQVAGSAAGQQAADLGAQITRRNLNVQPTIKVSVGYRFNVRVNRDIIFDDVY